MVATAQFPHLLPIPPSAPSSQVTVFEQAGSEDSLVASILLRSSVVSNINDLERACEDGLACVQHLCRNPNFVPGGGAAEMEVASCLRKLADETDSLDQYAIRKVRPEEERARGTEGRGWWWWGGGP